MKPSSSATTITGEAITDDCTKEIGITRERDVRARGIKRCEKVAGCADVDCLGASIRSESIELKMTGTTWIGVIAGRCRSLRGGTGVRKVRDSSAPINILIIEVAGVDVHISGKPNLRGDAIF